MKSKPQQYRCQDTSGRGAAHATRRGQAVVVMKYVLIIAAVPIVFLPACSNKSEKKAAGRLQPIIEHARKPESVQKPYYYGLIEEYKTVLQQDPANLAAMIGIGNAFSESGSWRDAILYYQQALKIDPANPDVHTDLGTAYRNIGLPERALTEYRIALKHDPAHLDARFKMGIVYAYDRKEYGVAIHVWEDLLRLSPNYPQADYIRTCMVSFRRALKKGNL